jgi:hypothetical protein
MKVSYLEGKGQVLSPLLGFNFEKDLQHDRHPEWKARNAKNHPDRQLVFSKDIAQQLRGSVSHLGLSEKVPFGCQVSPSLTTLVTLSSEPR